MKVIAAAGRAIRFVTHCIRLRSISRARWVDAYESFKPDDSK